MLLEQALANGRIGGRRAKRRRPKRLIAECGYGSNPLRALLVKRDIEPILPARRNNRAATFPSEVISTATGASMSKRWCAQSLGAIPPPRLTSSLPVPARDGRP